MGQRKAKKKATKKKEQTVSSVLPGGPSADPEFRAFFINEQGRWTYGDFPFSYGFTPGEWKSRTQLGKYQSFDVKGAIRQLSQASAVVFFAGLLENRPSVEAMQKFDSHLPSPIWKIILDFVLEEAYPFVDRRIGLVSKTWYAMVETLCGERRSLLMKDEKELGRRIGSVIHLTFASHFRRISTRIDEKRFIVMGIKASVSGPLDNRVGWICKGFDPKVLFPMLRSSLDVKETYLETHIGPSSDVQEEGKSDVSAFWYTFQNFFEKSAHQFHLCSMFEISAEDYLFELGHDAGESPFWKALLGDKINFIPDSNRISRAQLLENARKEAFLDLLFKD